jgi:dTDP-4-dehydrorhamnose reductase
MKILVAGAGGFIGKKIDEHFRRDHETISLTRADLDITSGPAVDDIVSRIRPDLVVNCVVLGLEASEADPEAARAVNIDGPANLGRAAAKSGGAIVHFSTNYVFGGDRREGYYTVDDEPQPVNVYGETKWAGEQALAAECSRHFIVRTSWVYGGSKASFFDRAIASLRGGESVEAIADNWGSPTFVEDLIERVEEVIDLGKFGTYHIANSGVCSKYEFAIKADRQINGDLGEGLVSPISAVHPDSSVLRPEYTPISCRLSAEIGLMPLRSWESAMEAFILRS